MSDLERAINLMRQRATAHEGREWFWQALGEHGYPQRVTARGNVALIAETFNGPDAPHPAAEHIAALDPATALAIADMLDLALAWTRKFPTSRPPWVQRAEAVAAQYLMGEP